MNAAANAGDWEPALEWYFHHRLSHGEGNRDGLCRFCPTANPEYVEEED